LKTHYRYIRVWAEAGKAYEPPEGGDVVGWSVERAKDGSYGVVWHVVEKSFENVSASPPDEGERSQ
jgi:hypothetical protein